MIITSKAREYFFNYPYLETFIIIGSYLAIGYYIDPKDIFMLKYDFSSLTIFLSIITLFHGISSGLLAMMILGVVMKFGYDEFKYLYFLKEFVLVMIFGEFHYYWTRAIMYHSAEDKFTREKLSELSKAFYMLKISHDQIEKSYVVKPMSLRNSILNLKEKFDENKIDIFYKDFLLLLEKTLNIESAFLISIKGNNSMSILAQTDKDEILEKNDLLILDTLKREIPLYVSSDDMYSESRYLAVIPIISNDTNIGLLIISKMPFMSFNKDNLISATILVNYMFDELRKLEIIREIDDFLPTFQINFRFESYRLKELNREYHTESTILIIKSYDKLKTHLMIESVNKNLRTLDVMSSIIGDTLDIIAILFPFADTTSVDGFIKRIYNNAQIGDKDNNVKQSSFSISDISLIEQYILD